MSLTTVDSGDIGVRVTTDDLAEVVRDPAAMRELRALLDRRWVVLLAPQQDITKVAFGELALALGFPEAQRHRSAGPPNAEGSTVPGYEFVADFGARAKATATPHPAREPSFIEGLHYDGISAYSMQANFHSPETTPNLWCDMRAAYRELPRHLRAIVDARAALHAVVPSPRTPLSEFPSFEASSARRRPLVIQHPRTREPLLYLPKNPASKIEGLPDDEGRSVLQELWDFVARDAPRYTSRIGHNELVIWDGLGTTHTNPSYPRARDRTVWFLIIPGPWRDVEAYAAAPRESQPTLS